MTTANFSREERSEERGKLAATRLTRQFVHISPDNETAVVLPHKPSSIISTSLPSAFCSKPVHRVSESNRPIVEESKPQVFESPKASIFFIFILRFFLLILWKFKNLYFYFNNNTVFVTVSIKLFLDKYSACCRIEAERFSERSYELYHHCIGQAFLSA